MGYSVRLSENAEKQLCKLDKPTKIMIMKWLRKNLEGCDDPRRHGRRLSGILNEMWRYRVGDYRLIADIIDDKIVILILEIGHRSAVYGR